MNAAGALARGLVALVLLAWTLCAQAAPERLAWVVGQEAYPNDRLRTVTHDVQAMAGALTRAGWKLRPPLIDATPQALTADLNAFLDRVRKSPGAEVFVYLSGHGVEVDGEARLRVITPPAVAGRPGSIATLSVPVLMAGIEAAGASLAVLVFDACRDTRPAAAYNALRSSTTAPRAGIARAGTMEHLVLYATASGSTAADGVAWGGVFTSELVAALGLGGSTVQYAFERARTQVWAQTRGRQRPEMAVSAGAVVFNASAPLPPDAPPDASAGKSVPDTADSAAPDERVLAAVRKALSADESESRGAFSEDDRQTERDIDYVLHLLIPPVQESQRSLDRLVAQGMPWAALVLALTQRNGDFGLTEPERARQIATQLRRAGLEARLTALHRRGSHAATSALALLSIMRDEGPAGRREARSLMLAAARAGYVPALQLHLFWSTVEGDADEVSKAAEEGFRTRAAAGDLAAQWTLATVAYVRTANDLSKGRVDDPAAARARMVAAMQPFRERGIPNASVLLIRAYLDPKLGPSDFESADRLCAAARVAREAQTIALCALSWSGRELPRTDAPRALAWMREAADLGDTTAGNQTGLWLRSGFGTAAPDPVLSFAYLNACADRGSLQCMVNAAQALRIGAGTPRDVRRAAELYASAATNGNNWAGNRLAEMLLDEPELRGDTVEIRRWLLHGIEQKDPEAWTTLGRAVHMGTAGLQRSPQAAIGLYAQAARMGSATGRARYCEMQVTGEGAAAEPERGLACLTAMTEAGDEMASMILASLFLTGRHVALDEPRAYRLYQTLADGGQPAALAFVGQFHEFGWGGQPVDIARARSAYQQAADKGSIDGLTYLGSLMARRGTSAAERRSGLAKLEDAATTGYATAQWFLARQLLAVATSDAEWQRAVTMLGSASDGGSYNARLELARRLVAGDGIERDVTRGREMLQAMATQNDYTPAMNELGLLAEFGKDTGKPDIPQSARWYGKAAAKGDGFALAKLGRYAMYGLGDEPVDMAKAVSLYRKASDAGDPWGTYLLGDAYAAGRGVSIDRERAQLLLLRAAQAGDQRAQADLGYYLMGNAGFTPDRAQALHWTRAAADQGHAQAMRRMWEVLSRGDGIPVDLPLAESWLRRAAAAGDADAVALLAQRASSQNSR